jgi:hypothetical protein
MRKNNLPNSDNQSSTQQYVPISEIHDNTVVMKDGSLRAVLMVSSLNFALKKEDERDAIIYGYQSFLNYLDFNIQILTQTRKLDLTNYLKKTGEQISNIENPLLQQQAESYLEFVYALLKYANVMDKIFYIVVPSHSNILQSSLNLIKNKDSASSQGNFVEHAKTLNQRVSVVSTLLSNLGLKSSLLNTEQLIELYYNTYNPDTSQNQKLPPLEEVLNIGVIKKQGQNEII